MIEWEHLFQNSILMRGYDYQLDGRVYNLHSSENMIEAEVEGNIDYFVKISVREGKITRMSCTCPYAADGTPCKHMAAVLYEYEDIRESNGSGNGEEAEEDEASTEDALRNHDGEHNRKTSSDDETSTKTGLNDHGSEPTLDEIVSNAPEDLIRHYLLEVLKKDEKLALRFRSLINPAISAEDMKQYKRRMDQLLRRYKGRSGFIEYRAASSFMNEVLSEMEDSLENIYGNQCYAEAFEFASYTFVQVSGVEMDDSDGELSWFAEECLQWWERILLAAEEAGDTYTQQAMFDWLTSHLDGSLIDYMEEHVEDFLKNHFTQGILQKKKLSFVDARIAEYTNTSGNWSGDYRVGGWLISRIEMMQNMNQSWNEIKAFCMEHWAHHSVRNWYAVTCKEKGDYEAAIATLEESLEMDNKYAGLVSDYCFRLKELYLITGRIQDYQKMLWRIVTEIKPGDLSSFRELRDQYSQEEWPEEREKLFKSLPYYVSKLELFREEGLFDRLMEGVMSSNGLYTARTYKKELLPLYPEKYLEKYAEDVENSALCVSNRARYRELADTLLEIRKMPGGRQKAEEIEQHWRMIYGNRRAMMDELNQMHRRREYQ